MPMITLATAADAVQILMMETEVRPKITILLQKVS
jgi:hypothetical protein